MRAGITRRTALKSGATFAATAAGTGPVRFAEAEGRAGSRYTWGHGFDFGEQYFVRMVEILECIRRNEMELVGDISSRMAETLKKGGQVWYDAYVGHMGRFECREENRGNPRIIRSNSREAEHDKMKPGDVYVTNYVNENVRKNRDNGVFVVGVPVCYIDNEWAPRGYVNPNRNNWLLGDVSNIILQSYIPHTQGIVECPEIPEGKLFPSSANSLCSLFWMFQAETASKLKNPKAKPVDLSAAVLDTVITRIRDAYRRQKDSIFDHAATVAKMIGNGAHYHVTSDHEGVQTESNTVAKGPRMTNAFRKEMKKGDVHLLASIEPDSRKIIDEAKKAKDMGQFVISIAPGNSPQIRRLSDVFIDNLSPEGGGLLTIPGFPEKVATVGGILNNTLMWIFTAQFVDEMVRRGLIPWFYMGSYTVEGPAYSKAMQPFFLRQGF